MTGLALLGAGIAAGLAAIGTGVGNGMVISKMLEVLDKTVERDEGSFALGGGDYLKNFKSYFHMELGREMAANDRTSFGFAKQIYQQMEKN